MDIIRKLILCLLPALFAVGIHAQTSTDDKLAIMFFQERDYEKAASLFEKLYDEKPQSYYYSYLIFCYLELGDYNGAEKLIKRQMKREPAAKRYAVDLGYVYLRQGETSRAKRQFDDILEELPADRNIISEVANAFLSRRENEYAFQVYQKGRVLLKGAYPFNLEMAVMYQSAGDFSSMMEEYLDYTDFDVSKVSFVQDRLQDVMNNDPDGTKGDVLRKALLRRIQKFPDRSYYSEMLIWYSVQQRDFELALAQSKALDRRNNEDGKRIFDLARLCINNEAYAVAEEAFHYVMAKGKEGQYYMESRIQLLSVSFLRITGEYTHTREQLLSLEKNFQTVLDELGRNAGTINLIRNYAHLEAFFLNDAGKAIELLNDAISTVNAPPAQIAQCKLELGDVLLFTGEIWDATLLYSQVDKAFKNDPLGHEAKYRNAKLSYYIGEFAWAKAQLDVLKAATSKLISNDAMDLSILIDDNLNLDTTGTALRLLAQGDLLAFQNRDDDAMITYDSIITCNVEHSLFDDVSYKNALIQIKKHNYALADTLLSSVVTKFPDELLADNALFKLAELSENILNNKERAMELYQELLTKYPGSLFVVEARKRFRTLRGDPLN